MAFPVSRINPCPSTYRRTYLVALPDQSPVLLPGHWGEVVDVPPEVVEPRQPRAGKLIRETLVEQLVAPESKVNGRNLRKEIDSGYHPALEC